MVSAIEEGITEKIECFFTAVVGDWGREKGDAKFTTKKKRVEIIGDAIVRIMARKTMECKTCQGV
jgi:hypothetical protein